ncbi:MAG: hypothetical protein GKC53_00050 [Neisseriaceae bacterium]|nr:MAG: hypothetical protein GKC53_00050 [Neisseriaceae bacterium]
MYFFLTLFLSFLAVSTNVVLSVIIAWPLAGYSFVDTGLLNSIIYLPFSLQTFVTGIILVVLYVLNGRLGSLFVQNIDGLQVSTILPELKPTFISSITISCTQCIGEYSPVITGNILTRLEISLLVIASKFEQFALELNSVFLILIIFWVSH